MLTLFSEGKKNSNIMTNSQGEAASPRSTQSPILDKSSLTKLLSLVIILYWIFIFYLYKVLVRACQVG